jgi:hypothetical protein
VVVVTDRSNDRLSLWRLGDGTVWKHLGSRGTEPGQFTYPRAVAVTGAGALAVTDQHRVQVLTVDGAVLCVLDPTALVGVGRLGRYLSGVALYPGTDEILVTDYLNHRLVALSWSPQVVVTDCVVYTSLDFRWCVGLMMGFSDLFVVFSADYWMRGHLAVEAHNWTNSTFPVVSQLHPWEICWWQTRTIIALSFCDNFVP